MDSMSHKHTSLGWILLSISLIQNFLHYSDTTKLAKHFICVLWVSQHHCEKCIIQLTDDLEKMEMKYVEWSLKWFLSSYSISFVCCCCLHGQPAMVWNKPCVTMCPDTPLWSIYVSPWQTTQNHWYINRSFTHPIHNFCGLI